MNALDKLTLGGREPIAHFHRRDRFELRIQIARIVGNQARCFERDQLIQLIEFIIDTLEIDSAQSHCIRNRSCAELVASGVCDRESQAAADPYARSAEVCP